MGKREYKLNKVGVGLFTRKVLNGSRSRSFSLILWLRGVWEVFDEEWVMGCKFYFMRIMCFLGYFLIRERIKVMFFFLDCLGRFKLSYFLEVCRLFYISILER